MLLYPGQQRVLLGVVVVVLVLVNAGNSVLEVNVGRKLVASKAVLDHGLGLVHHDGVDVELVADGDEILFVGQLLATVVNKNGQDGLPSLGVPKKIPTGSAFSSKS